MFAWIDAILNKVTMYRLILYFLLLLLGVATLFCFLGILPFNPLALIFSTLFLIMVCWVSNEICAKIFCASTNVESIYITALILALLISPLKSPFDANFFSLAIWASLWAMASKYVLAIGKKHIFNPAAFAVALMALASNQSASWWIGTLSMMPFVLVGGLLIVRKIRQFDLVLSFFGMAFVAILGSGFIRGVSPVNMIIKTVIDTPLLFFAFVMLTEPLTTPPTTSLRLWYGAIVGFLFAPWVHLGTLYTTPEIALVLGNVFSYLVSPKQKLLLHVKEQIVIADHVKDFLFRPERPLAYKPGQYMEWTLAHDCPDSRGNRRYFTLASSPTEEDLRLGVKFYPKGSSFKRAFSDMVSTDIIVASQLAGDFVLPDDLAQKLVFIAGGIGVTPFRSMIKYLVDRKEKRDVVLFYSNNFSTDIAYADVFDEARSKLAIKTVYVLTDVKSVPLDWKGRVGCIDAKMIEEEVPDFAKRIFYLSGPHGMVVAFERTLKTIGVPKSSIKRDFFPGFA